MTYICARPSCCSLRVGGSICRLKLLLKILKSEAEKALASNMSVCVQVTKMKVISMKQHHLGNNTESFLITSVWISSLFQHLDPQISFFGIGNKFILKKSETILCIGSTGIKWVKLRTYPYSPGHKY